MEFYHCYWLTFNNAISVAMSIISLMRSGLCLVSFLVFGMMLNIVSGEALNTSYIPIRVNFNFLLLV